MSPRNDDAAVVALRRVVWAVALFVTAAMASFAGQGSWSSLRSNLQSPFATPASSLAPTLACCAGNGAIAGTDRYIITNENVVLFTETATNTATAALPAWQPTYAALSSPNSAAGPVLATHVINGALYAIRSGLAVSVARGFSSTATTSAHTLLTGWFAVTPTAGPSPTISGAGFSSWTYLDRYLVVFGGETPSGLTRAVWAFDTTTYTWVDWTAPPAASPSARSGACCATAPGSAVVYCYGGVDALRANLADVWRFDSVTLSWTLLASSAATSAPSGRYSSGCAVRGSDFVVIGGVVSGSGTPVTSDNNAYFFSTFTSLWRTVAQTAFASVGRASLCVTSSGRLVAVAAFVDSDVTATASFVLPTATDTFSKTAVDSATTSPAGRWGHIALSTASRFYVGLGAASAGGIAAAVLFSDMWAYDASTSVWTRVASQWSTGPAARVGSAAAAKGPSIYVTGGQDASGAVLADLWAFSVNSATWRLVVPSGGPPTPARAFASAQMANGLYMVLAFGLDAASVPQSTWFTFDVSTERWATVAVPANMQAVSGAIAVPATRSAVLAGLGTVDAAAGTTSGQLWTAEISGPGDVQFTAFSAAVTTPTTLTLARGGATAVNLGEEVLICGGVGQGFRPLQASETCFVVNTRSTVVEAFASSSLPPVVARMGGAAYVGNQVFAFGGQVVSTSGVATTIATPTLAAFTIPVAALCTTTSTVAAPFNCVACSAGYLPASGSGCTAVAAGSYVSAPGNASFPCRAGTASSTSGASDGHFCALCPVGTFNTLTGQPACTTCTTPTLCAAGSTSNGVSLAAFTAFSNASFNSSQPQPYSPAPPPVFVWYIVIAVCVIVLVLPSLIHLRYFLALRKRRGRMLNTAAKAYLKGLHARYSAPIGKLALTQALRIFANEDALRPHAATGPVVTDLFGDHDRDGDGSLDDFEFLDMIIAMVDLHLMAPFEDFVDPLTTAPGDNVRARKLNTNVGDEKKFPEDAIVTKLEPYTLPHFDIFCGRHIVGARGTPLRNVRTSCGGFVSLLMVALGVLLTLALTVQFAFSNLVEERALVPRAVIDGEFSSTPEPRGNITVVATARLVGASLVAATATSTATARGFCIVAGTNSTCRGSASLDDLQGGIKAVPASQLSCASTEATTTSPATCTMTYSCANCTYGYGTNVAVDFQFPGEGSATSVAITTAATSGLRPSSVDSKAQLLLVAATDAISSVFVNVAPPTVGNVFRGRPATTATFSLTPTFFVSSTTPLASLTAEKAQSRGFHVSATSYSAGASGEGASTSPELGIGVSARAVLVVDITPLLVKRGNDMSEPIFVAVVVGGLAGVGTLAFFVIRIADMMAHRALLRRLQKHTQAQRNEAASRVLPSDREADPYFLSLERELQKPTSSAATANEPIEGDESTDEEDNPAEPAVMIDATAAAVKQREDDFKYRQLDLGATEQEAVAGLVAAAVPVHIALEHWRMIMRAVGKRDGGDDDTRSMYPVIDPFLNHQTATALLEAKRKAASQAKKAQEDDHAAGNAPAPGTGKSS